MSENLKLKMVQDFWRHSDEGLRDERKRMTEGFRFYTGDQWDPADIARLTVNITEAQTGTIFTN